MKLRLFVLKVFTLSLILMGTLHVQQPVRATIVASTFSPSYRLGLSDVTDQESSRFDVKSDSSIKAAIWQSPQFLLKWGTTGTANGQFNCPIGIAEDGNGFVYVADSKNNRVQKFDGFGNYLLEWSSSNPSDIAIDELGNVYVAEYYSGLVKIFDANGILLQSFIGGTLPRGIAIDSSSGNVYVADEREIIKFDSSGEWLTAWDTNDGYETDVVTDSTGNVYVVSYQSNQVRKFSENGILLGVWGSINGGSEPGEFSGPLSLAVDSLDNVYVVDTLNSRIQVLNTDGAFIGMWGTNGEGNGQFNDIWGVSVNSKGIIFVSDCALNRIQKFGGGLAAFSISGNIMDANSNPIAGVTVSSNTGHSATTNANGDYTITDLSAGTYTITASKTDYIFSPSSRTISVNFDKSGQDFVANSLSQGSSVPFFWQRDDRWKNHPLGTNGQCSAFCNTIGACGCTLTSSTMVFAYYGASLTPPTLSDCMGTNACPFNYENGVSCTGNLATFVGKYSFSWSRLEQELNQYNRPVLLGMHRKGNRNDTHWVVILSGNGSNPANYKIHDPLFTGGNDVSLLTRVQDYDFDSLVVYGGQPAYLGSLVSETNDDTLDLEPISSSSVQQADSAFQPQLDFIGATSSSIISGTILIYRLSEATLTIQLISDSSEGNITEMQLWTDSYPASEWQPIATLISLPLSETVYARFRDEIGNESVVYSDSIFPQYSPPPNLLNVFLPAVLRGQ